uniref:Uncharacterized protein n=1 Tax=Gouania willdenowi TaxID=441366 RepID=A0A8C5HC14_GOUWI
MSNLDSCTPTFPHSIRHSSTRRVNHGHETDKAKLLSGEVHLISIERKALRELIVSQAVVTKIIKITPKTHKMTTKIARNL